MDDDTKDTMDVCGDEEEGEGQGKYDHEKFLQLQEFLSSTWGEEKARILYQSIKDADDAKHEASTKSIGEKVSRSVLTNLLQDLAQKKDQLKKALAKADKKIEALDKQLTNARTQRDNFQQRMEEVESRYSKTYETIGAIDANSSEDEEGQESGVDWGAEGHDEQVGAESQFDAEANAEHFNMDEDEETTNAPPWQPAAQTTHDRKAKAKCIRKGTASSSSTSCQTSGAKYFRPQAKAAAANTAGTKAAPRSKIIKINLAKGKEAKSQAIWDDALKQAQEKIEAIEANKNEEDEI